MWQIQALVLTIHSYKELAMGLALGLLREDFTRGREGKAGPAEAAAGARVEAGAEPPGVGRGWGPRDKKGEASYE